MEQKPSIGRIVHYTNLGDKDGKYPPEVQAALITGVYFTNANEGQPMAHDDIHPDNGTVSHAGTRIMFVDLRVFYRTGDFHMKKVPWSEAPERGSWNWPPKN